MSTPQVAFYILPEEHEIARLNFACRLAEKAYRKNMRVYIHTDSKANAHKMDEHLWAYRDDSFLPHNLLDEKHGSAPPIQIGCGETPGANHAILINLTEKVPEFYNCHQRIFEIIIKQDDAQKKGRERYKQYQQSQCAVMSHNMDPAATSSPR